MKCVTPADEKLPDVKAEDQNDSDIVSSPDTGGVKSSELTPGDIVLFFSTAAKCLYKYLPFNTPRLQQFVICIVMQGFCRKI